MRRLEAFKSSSSRSREKGVILLVTLWIAVVLAIIAYSLSYQVRLEMKLTKQFRQSAQARALAQVGIAKAVADLKNDLIIDTSETTKQLPPTILRILSIKF